jgi:hypothetical protein
MVLFLLLQQQKNAFTLQFFVANSVKFSINKGSGLQDREDAYALPFYDSFQRMNPQK